MRRTAPMENVAAPLIASPLIEGTTPPGDAIGLGIDQTLTQNATGAPVMLALEAFRRRLTG